MKGKFKLVGLSVFVLTFITLLGVRIYSAYHFVSATPETESVFLKDYAPQPVVAPFIRGNSGWDNGQGAGAGIDHATHHASFQGEFSIEPERWNSLMDTLSTYTSEQLARDHAQILNQHGNARDGFQFVYKLGKSFGSLHILPLAIKGHAKDVDGNLAVQLNIDLEETYFRKEPGIVSVTVENNLR